MRECIKGGCKDMKRQYNYIKVKLARYLLKLNIPFGKYSYENLKWYIFQSELGYFDDTASFEKPKYYGWPHKIFLYENTRLAAGAKFIQSNATNGKFIMKKNSGVAQDLTIITNNHTTKPIIGQDHRVQIKNHDSDTDEDIIIEEDVWIGINVTLMPGVIVGRGSIVGTGSIVTKNIPPYSICVGVPAKFKKFKYTIEEILEHESKLYPKEERFSKNELLDLFDKFEK